MSDRMERLIYRQTMKHVRASLKSQRYNLTAANYGSHEGFMAQVLVRGCGYFLTVRSNENHRALFLQVHLPFWVPFDKREEIGAFLNRETANHAMGRMDLDEDGMLSALVSIPLTGYAENYERLCQELPEALGKEGEKLTGAARKLLLECCCPSETLFIHLEDYLLSMAYFYQKKLEPMIYGTCTLAGRDPEEEEEEEDEEPQQEEGQAGEEDADEEDSPWQDEDEEFCSALFRLLNHRKASGAPEREEEGEAPEEEPEEDRAEEEAGGPGRPAILNLPKEDEEGA